MLSTVNNENIDVFVALFCLTAKYNKNIMRNLSAFAKSIIGCYLLLKTIFVTLIGTVLESFFPKISNSYCKALINNVLYASKQYRIAIWYKKEESL